MEWYIAAAIVLAAAWLLINYTLNGMTVTLGETRFLVRILYKSGNSQEVWLKSFTTTNASDGAIRSMEWKEYGTTAIPISIGAVENIEAVFQLEVIKSIWALNK